MGVGSRGAGTQRWSSGSHTRPAGQVGVGVGVNGMQWPISSCQAWPGGQGVGVGVDVGVGVYAMQCPISSCQAWPDGQPLGVGPGAVGVEAADAMQCPICSCQKYPAGHSGVEPDCELGATVTSMQCPMSSCQK